MSQAIGNMSIYVGAYTDPMREAFRRSVLDVKDFARDMRGGMMSAVSLGNMSLTNILGLGLAVASAGTLTMNMRDIVSESIAAAAQFEIMSNSFELFTGNAKTAKNLLDDIRLFATESPLTFADAAGQAKTLLSYGTPTDQIVPTMKALSELSGGQANILARLVYAYGQVRAAGRLYGTELRQFTETGIPLLDALAVTMGKPKEDLRGMMEAGRVGFNDLVRAIKHLTEEGGKFSGQSERYAQSYYGHVDRLRDALDEFKRTFGKALIEELGLVEATKDLGKWTDRVQNSIDSWRPTIRFVADSFRGFFQIINETAKGATIGANAFFEGFEKMNPNIAMASRNLKAMIEDAKNFKIDPIKAVEFGFSLAEAFGTVVDEIFTDLANLFDQAIKPTLIDVKDIVTETKNITMAIKGVLEALRGPAKFIENRENRAEELKRREDWIAKPEDLRLQQTMLRLGAQKQQEAFDKLRLEREDLLAKGDIAKADAVFAKMNAINTAYVKMQQDVLQMLREEEAMVRAKFIPGDEKPKFSAVGGSPFGGGRDPSEGYEHVGRYMALRDSIDKNVAALFQQIGVKDEVAEAKKGQKTAFEIMKESFQATRKTTLENLRATLDREKVERQMAARQDELAQLAQKNGKSYRDATVLLQGGLDPLAISLAGMAMAVKDSKTRLKEVFEVPTWVVELSKNLNEQYNTIPMFEKKIDEIQTAFAYGKIDSRVRDLGIMGLTKELAQRFGITNKVQLPNAAVMGSEAAATLAAVATAQGGPRSVPELLQMIKEIEKAQLEEAVKIRQTIGRPVPTINMPGD